jgi:hypothetical protein
VIPVYLLTAFQPGHQQQSPSRFLQTNNNVIGLMERFVRKRIIMDFKYFNTLPFPKIAKIPQGVKFAIYYPFKGVIIFSGS